jgi:hypothetical protein
MPSPELMQPVRCEMMVTRLTRPRGPPPLLDLLENILRQTLPEFNGSDKMTELDLEPWYNA